MNCANHPDRERAAFCQNCGKPLCTECIRTLGTSIFCEPCYAARIAAPGFAPGSVPPGYTPSPGVPGEPNPGLAALLGFIPGVGAMYNEQYAKGIVHLVVFAILVSLASDVNGIFGLFIAGWICYMVIEAHHTARARRDGTPLPNPFGLNDLSERLGFGRAWPAAAAPFAANPGPAAQPGAYAPPVSSFVDASAAPPYGSAPPYSYVPPASSWGAPQDAYAYGPPPIPTIPPVPGAPPVPPYPDPNLPYYRRFPAGAIWLIALGVLFLFGNTGVFVIHARYFGPFLLIAIGVWIFVRRMTATGEGFADVGDPNYHWRLARACRGSVWLVLTGILWLLDAFHILTWAVTWPLFLIAGGIMLFFKRVMYGYPPPPYDPAAYGPYPGAPYTPPTPPVASTGLVPANPTSSPSSTQEGR